MSTEKKEEAKPAAGETKAAEGAVAAAPPAAPKKPSAIGGMLKVVIPAVFAAGAAYGGTRYAKAQSTVVVVQEATSHGDDKKKHEAHPPGPTVPLEPFLITVWDAGKKAHPMKMSIAVEFDAKSHDDPKPFVPRIRDAVLTHLRTMTHEQATDSAHIDKLRAELLERCREAGASSAEKVLITDFVVQ